MLKNIDSKMWQTALHVSFMVMILKVLAYFIIYFQTIYNLENPLIPSYMIDMVFEPFAIRGLSVSIGMLLGYILKMINRISIAVLNNIFWIALGSFIHLIVL